MPLGSAKTGQRDGVTVTNLLGDVDEPVVTLIFGTLNVTITPATTAQDGKGPTVLGQTGRDVEQDRLHTVVTHTVCYATTLLLVGSASDDVDGTTH